MTRTANPRLRMLAGPNGSGKTTLFNYLRQAFSFPFGYCLNPDDLDSELVRYGRVFLGAWGAHIDNDSLHAFVTRHGLASRLAGPLPNVEGNALVAPAGYQRSYFPSIFGDFLRQLWMAKEESFTFETVMSHPDRVQALEEARSRGYRTYLYFVCTDNVDINVGRIASRVAQGGHDVPESVRRNRYRRSLALLPRAIEASSRAYLFDNSGSEHQLVAEYESAKLVQRVEDLPRWFPRALRG